MAALTREQTDTVKNLAFAEAGSDPNEIVAVVSTIMNNIDRFGFDRAMKFFAAFTKKSPQFRMAEGGEFDDASRKKFSDVNFTVDALAGETPEGARLPFTNFENVNAFGDPPFADKATSQMDIGQQRFFTIPQNAPRRRALIGR